MHVTATPHPFPDLSLRGPSGTLPPPRRNRAFVSDPERCVTHPLPSSALREWRAHMARPRLLLALLGIGLALALAGPFGTATTMPWPYRVAYWVCVPALTYGIGYLVHVLLAPPLQARLPHRLARGAAILLTGVAICATVSALNLLVFSLHPSATDIAVLFGITLLVSALIELLPHTPPPTPDAPDAAQPPALLDRMSLARRGPLVSLSVEDHYVRIRTLAGEEMVLLRLSDAIREAAPTPGLRVHRSHWIALAQIRSATRKGDGAVLQMTRGDDIPVSRSHMASLRQSGLLPR